MSFKWLQENIPGSQQYKQLLQQALQAFVQSPAYRQAVAAAQGPASRIDTALQSHPIQSAEEQHKLEEVGPHSQPTSSYHIALLIQGKDALTAMDCYC